LGTENLDNSSKNEETIINWSVHEKIDIKTVVLISQEIHFFAK
jgi:hypothetical protein